MYTELASWFHLLTAPADYVEEATQALRLLTEATGASPQTILELGSGGGNNASHMKAHATLTLTDVSPEMLALSRTLNPECEHLVGDMRTLRLGRIFDAVFVHDAVSYLTSETTWRRRSPPPTPTAGPAGRPCSLPTPSPSASARAPTPAVTMARATSTAPCAIWSGPGTPIRTTPGTSPSTPTCSGTKRTARPRSGPNGTILGLFSRATWLSLLTDAGFVAETRQSVHDDEADAELFLARRP